ncbi:MAG: GNAT family N-acetyltransferase [Candidatus Contendobacter sp.]|nr:GNAT family N-acetyltransferase [Candidatus Contendobacter sp.]
MLKKGLTLSRLGLEDFLVRSIEEEDIELLRIWKNYYRDRFFFKGIITESMQKNWFDFYLKREHDFMLIILNKKEKIGCLGFRRLDDRVDLYNLIIGQRKNSGNGHMTNALDLVCKEIKKRYQDMPIMVSVLKQNPNLQWYFRRDFIVVTEYPDYLDLRR